MSFTAHLLEAIWLNFRRSFYYAQRSFGATLPLSFLLIFLELFILPFALFFDIWALKYNVEGISIVKDDFVSMALVKEKTSPSTYHKSHLLSAININTAESFEKIYDDIVNAIERVKAQEKEHQAHFAMSLHILESVALFSKHAIGYTQQNRKTLLLCKVMLNFQLVALYSSGYFDYLAQQFHKRGVGIVVNDLPSIEF